MESSEDLDSPLHSKHCSYTHSNSSTQTDPDQILPFSLSLPLFLPSSKLQIIYMQRTAHTHTFSPPSLPSFLIHTHTNTHDSPPLQRLAGNLHTQSLTYSLLTQPPTSPSSKSISSKPMPPSRHHTPIRPSPPLIIFHPPPPYSRPTNESVR